MKCFLIVGYGSIAKRHLNNLIQLGYDNIIIIARTTNDSINNHRQYTSLHTAIAENKVTHALICTPTANHFDSLKILLQHHIPNIYLEKPVSHNLDQLQEIMPLLENAERIVVGYDLHFDPGLIRVKEIMDKNDLGKMLSMNAVVGQFLPDWRPYEDYRSGMSASIAKGGGVMLDLVHEFDYLRWIAGNPESIACFSQHNPILEIETEDIADVLIRFEGNVTATLHLDYHQRKLVRHCIITCEKGTIFWDLASSQVRVVTQEKEDVFSYGDFERNQRFMAILEAFLDKDRFDWKLTTFEQGLISLKMVLSAKESDIDKKIINL